MAILAILAFMAIMIIHNRNKTESHKIEVFTMILYIGPQDLYYGDFLFSF